MKPGSVPSDGGDQHIVSSDHLFVEKPTSSTYSISMAGDLCRGGHTTSNNMLSRANDPTSGSRRQYQFEYPDSHTRGFSMADKRVRYTDSTDFSDSDSEIRTLSGMPCVPTPTIDR